MESKSKIFKYTYSASQQEEIKKIRKKYAPPTQEEDKMERLRRLDESATKSGRIVSLIVGIVSCLVMGFGMCCTMVWNGLMIQGIIIGLVGIAGVVSAYPLYVKITKKRREKLAPEIIRLTDELMK
ncbi:MAG: hypothetical protein NC205_01485 [Prevotella sp.]|nr:hypothetical protein [Alistipes senegalensis]MCM1357238.1 hypothetical protein [Prevotella sp.]MCM1472846.1 hypothetical protein [Muribaculaceae bacterium]